MHSIPGVLRTVKQNHHFPGNTLHLEPNQYHSIVPIGGANSKILTFVARRLCSTAAETTFVLSSSDSIQAPTDEIRPATAEERQLIHEKLIMYAWMKLIEFYLQDYRNTKRTLARAFRLYVKTREM
ncbi:unnamed protein product [Adineta ricciae]|uniref:Uncharacterized protein n=1 Tax=Adineta ricciae TaxID=249248 RepID=A0A815CQU5_ADIRI|nr:unnamed protein product [Adineta ricciae]